MQIEVFECQKIVDRVISILGKNINIMNSDGIIIASGDSSRVGAFHEAANIAAKTKSEMTVEKNDDFIGCKKGVNIPIYHDNEVLGVIGITGEPSDVKNYGKIVKELVELMIQEDERKNIELYQATAIRNFANELIKEQDERNLELLGWRTHLVNFDLQVERQIIVLDICSFGDVVKKYSTNSEIMIQKFKQKVVDTIYNVSDQMNDLIFNLYEDRFIIFRSKDKEISTYCENVQKTLSDTLELTVYMGLGSVCREISDYHKSFLTANSVLDVGRKIHPGKHIYIGDDYRIQLLLQTLNKKQKEQYYQSFRDIFGDKPDAGLNEILKTVKVFFENGMSLKNTSAAMFVHRNTVLYRIKKLNESYNINVLDPYTCMLIYIGINLKELE